jgi:hypothetical protein
LLLNLLLLLHLLVWCDSGWKHDRKSRQLKRRCLLFQLVCKAYQPRPVILGQERVRQSSRTTRNVSLLSCQRGFVGHGRYLPRVNDEERQLIAKDARLKTQPKGVAKKPRTRRSVCTSA